MFQVFQKLRVCTEKFIFLFLNQNIWWLPWTLFLLVVSADNLMQTVWTKNKGLI